MSGALDQLAERLQRMAPVVSFPLLLDRDVRLGKAVAISVRSVMANLGPMALWGLIVAGGLVIGTIPLFLGLVIVLPVLSHATWHLYRKRSEEHTSELQSLMRNSYAVLCS